MNRLSPSSVASFVVGHGLVAASQVVEVRILSSGFTNTVFRVATATGRDIVVKQSYEASERTALRADIGRALYEVDCMRALKEILGPGCPTPEVLAADPVDHVVAMVAAPRDATRYDDELRAGHVDPAVTDRITAYLVRLHSATEGDRTLQRRFRTNPGFELRAQSIRSVGLSHPDLQRRIDVALDRNRTEGRVLVDANVTPKNVLLHGVEITKLDFVCAQWGDPALDLGIFLAHYPLMVFGSKALPTILVAEARRAFDNYIVSRGEYSSEFLSRTIEYMALMMLGRADGDFVFDYLQPHRATVCELARRLLGGSFTSFGDVHGMLIDSLSRVV